MAIPQLRQLAFCWAVVAIAGVDTALADFNFCVDTERFRPGFQETFKRAVACLRTVPEIAPIVDRVESSGKATLCHSSDKGETSSSGIIPWNPDAYGVPLNGGRDGTNLPIATLAHELCHADETIRNLLRGWDDKRDLCGVPRNETDAIRRCENFVRQAGFRTATYGGALIDCPMGEDPSLPTGERRAARNRLKGLLLCCGNGTLDKGEPCDASDPQNPRNKCPVNQCSSACKCEGAPPPAQCVGVTPEPRDCFYVDGTFIRCGAPVVTECGSCATEFPYFNSFCTGTTEGDVVCVEKHNCTFVTCSSSSECAPDEVCISSDYDCCSCTVSESTPGTCARLCP